MIIRQSVELYSPTGKCNHQLASLPVYVGSDPVVGFIKKPIVACYGRSACWRYQPFLNIWKTISSADYDNKFHSGAVYLDRIYIHNANNSKAFHPTAPSWSNWLSPLLISEITPGQYRGKMQFFY